MTGLGALSVLRSHLAAALVVGTMTLGVTGAVVSSAGQAAAGTTSTVVAAWTTPTARSVAALPVAPLTVPAHLTFELDVVPMTVTPDAAPVPAAGPAASRSGARPAVPADVREVAAATLAQLPASSGVALLFDPPELGSHLGGVFMGSPGFMLINASRLAGDPDRTRDVVRHEIAHIYQARLAGTVGFDAVDARMVELFGPGGLERAADCVALSLGATWTHYTTDCAGAERVAAVQALIAGRMP